VGLAPFAHRPMPRGSALAQELSGCLSDGQGRSLACRGCSATAGQRTADEGVRARSCRARMRPTPAVPPAVEWSTPPPRG
jgi:hypothetical protein